MVDSLHLHYFDICDLLSVIHKWYLKILPGVGGGGWKQVKLGHALRQQYHSTSDPTFYAIQVKYVNETVYVYSMLNCRIPCHLFACHWIRIASIVLCFVLQRTPTNENNGGTEWRGIQQLLVADKWSEAAVTTTSSMNNMPIGVTVFVKNTRNAPSAG